jgi:hypothetical protein
MVAFLKINYRTPYRKPRCLNHDKRVRKFSGSQMIAERRFFGAL